MAVQIWKESDFRREIKTNPKTGYLFFGEEDYLKSYAVKAARDAICPDPNFLLFNEMKLNALDFTPDKLIDALSPMPMMAERKLVILSGIDFNAMRTNDFSDFCDSLSALSEYDYNCLIVTVASDCLDAGSLPKKPSQILLKLSEYLTPVFFEKCSDAKLLSWMQKHFTHNGVTASDDLCREMLDYCGHSMFSLSGEIDKLSYFALANGKNTVDRGNLHLVCTSALEYDAFAFTNAIMDGESDTALEILTDYRFRKIDPIIVFGEVSRVVCDMVAVSALSKEGLSAEAVSAATKIHTFRVGLYQKSLQKSSDRNLRRLLENCRDADASIKLSQDGYAILQRLICSM